MSQRGGLTQPEPYQPEREVYLLQRKNEKHGASLGKTTGWIHRTTLKNRNVVMIGGVTYDKVDDVGLHYTQDGKQKVLEVDTIIVCIGQEPLQDLKEGLLKAGIPTHLIGGADVAAELDAKRAIAQAAKLAASV